MKMLWFAMSMAVMTLCLPGQAVRAQSTTAVVDQSRTKAIAFLKTSQLPDGSYTTNRSSGITALVVHGLLQAGVPETDPVVAKALDRVAAFAQPDGSIAAPKSPHAGYETSVSVIALSAGNKSGQYTDILKKADAYIRSMQFGASTNTPESDIAYGGVGYSAGGGRPDLSNTAFFLEAMQASGVGSDDPAVKNAITFLSRCQNLESEYNTTPQAAKVNDGGFYYNPTGAGASAAGKTDDGGLRSYGSMTYAGFKSMLYAGLKKDDKRVKAALEWIAKNYTVEENPGLGANGLYYYFYLFSKAMAANGDSTFQDAAGKSHDWRAELAKHIASLQEENGSWVNDQSARWMEGDPNLCTAYALGALNYCVNK